MKNVVDVAFLKENRDQLVLVDTTNNFLNAAEGKEKYAKGHIAGAYHVDLYEDMCAPGADATPGGRNPLPVGMAKFVQKLESIGISNATMVVTYDENMATAGRFWWMCKYIGIERVFVLNGGVGAWLEDGGELTGETTALPEGKGKIEIRLNPSMIATVDEVLAKIGDPKVALVDCRTKVRYTGEREVVNKIAGHIPSAKSYFYGEVLDNAYYKDLDFLREHFRGLENFDEVIAYCGSGVSAPVNIIALAALGISAKLYVGSWSDYISCADRVIATGEE